jgi:hypothetical protein
VSWGSFFVVTGLVEVVVVAVVDKVLKRGGMVYIEYKIWIWIWIWIWDWWRRCKERKEDGRMKNGD